MLPSFPEGRSTRRALGEEAMATGPAMPSMATAQLTGHIMDKAFDPTVTDIFVQVGLQPDASKLEIQQRVWSIYAHAVDVRVPVVSADEKKWLVRRDIVHNDRGDVSSIDQKAASMKTCGMIWGIGGGPFLVQLPGQPIIGTDVEYEALHWATRVEGLKQAWQDDVKKECRPVQMSVSAGLHHCTIFIARTTSLVRMWLKDLGNSENHSATTTTFLEKMRSTDAIEKSFESTKKDNCWTVDGLGQAIYEAKKRELMQHAFENRWGSSRQYEFCKMVYWNMNKYTLPTPTEDWVVEVMGAKVVSGAPTFWDVFVCKAMKEVDFTNKQHDEHSLLWSSFYNIFKIFKEWPQVCLELMMLLCPLRTRHTLKVPLLQQGLQTPVFKQVGVDMLACFKTDMAGSATAKKRRAIAESGKKRPTPDEHDHDLCKDGQSFMDSLKALRAYLERIVKNDGLHDKYIVLCCVAAMQDGIKLDGADKEGIFKPGCKFVRGFAQFSKVIKSETYRRAKLLPRISDVDFEDQLHGPTTLNGQQQELQEMGVEQMREFLEGERPLFEAFLAYVEVNKPTSPIQMHIGAAYFTNELMMQCMVLLQDGSTSVDRVSQVVLERMNVKVYELLPLKLDDAFLKLSRLCRNEKFTSMFGFLQGQGDNIHIVAVAQKVLAIVGGHANVERLLKMLNTLRIRIMANACRQLSLMSTFCRNESGSLVKANFFPQGMVHIAQITLKDHEHTTEGFADSKLIGIIGDSDKRSDAVLMSFWSHCLHASRHMEMYPTDAHVKAVKEYKQTLAYQLCDSQLAKACSEHKVDIKLPTILYKESKQQAVAKMVAIFGDKHPNERKSASLASDDGCMPMILEALLPNQPAALGEGDATDAQSESSQVSLTQWALELVNSEMEEGMAEIIKRVVVAKANAAMAEIGIEFMNQPCEDVSIEFKGGHDAGNAAKKPTKAVLHFTREGANVEIPFWGKVVDATHVSLQGRVGILSLGGTVSINLALDGNSAMNSLKSDCCPAWFARFPQPTKEEAKAKEQQQDPGAASGVIVAEGTTESPSASASASAASAKKKKSLKRASKANPTAKEAAPIIPNTTIDWRPLQIVVGEVVIVFNRPVLVSSQGVKPGLVVRPLTDFELSTKEQVRKIGKSSLSRASFANC